MSIASLRSMFISPLLVAVFWFPELTFWPKSDVRLFNNRVWICYEVPAKSLALNRKPHQENCYHLYHSLGSLQCSSSTAAYWLLLTDPLPFEVRCHKAFEDTDSAILT